MERLQKVIASCGICSRRHAEELITSGNVKVNGIITTELGTKVDFDDEIEVNGVKIQYEKKVYYLLNKPEHTITTSSDTHDRVTVIDLVKDKIKERVFAVGRLDYDTTGVLILTNDGDLSNHLIHPRYEINKTYHALIKGNYSLQQLAILEKGVFLEDGFAKANKVDVIKKNKDTTLVSITINVGKKHIVKRMIKYIGSEVIHLHRKSIDFLDDSNLAIGEFRPLTDEEIDKLKNL